MDKWESFAGVSMFVAVENECDAVRDIPIARWDWLPGGEMR